MRPAPDANKCRCTGTGTNPAAHAAGSVPPPKPKHRRSTSTTPTTPTPARPVRPGLCHRWKEWSTHINHTNYPHSHVMYEHGKIQIHPITPITMYKSNQSTEFGNNPSPHYPAMSRILPKRPKYWAYQLYQINDTSNPYADLTTYWTTYPRPTENSQHTKPSQTPKSFDESPCITAHNCSNIPETKKTRGIYANIQGPAEPHKVLRPSHKNKILRVLK